jgi:hypothetical protein
MFAQTGKPAFDEDRNWANNPAGDSNHTPNNDSNRAN